MTSHARLFLVTLLLGVAACAPKREPAPEQSAETPPTSRPTVALPAPAPAATEWLDLPLAPGNWTYRDEGESSAALFGETAGIPGLVVRCVRASRQVLLSRTGTVTATSITLDTSSGRRALPVAMTGDRGVGARLAAGDRVLDDMIFSRGRFAVTAPGAPQLVVPAGPEPARVVEDCRLA